MNAWVAKLGAPFSELEAAMFERFCRSAVASCPVLQQAARCEFSVPGVDYRALASHPEVSGKACNVVDASGELLAFSGLLLGTAATGEADLRSATCFRHSGISAFAAMIRGQFSLLRAANGHFECVVDALGSHKVFYCRANSDAVWVTNQLDLLRHVRGHHPSLERAVEWIGTGELWGYATDDVDVQTLPEHGMLNWSQETGLTVASYRPLADLIPSADSSFGNLLDEATNEFRTVSRYLGSHHHVALSLSGGYDSRVLLAMLRDTPRERITCFTYPDHSNDIRLAKTIASRYGFRHKVVGTSGAPSLPDAREFVQHNSPPFPDYNRIFNYAVHDGILAQFAPGRDVRVIGLGGEPGVALDKLGTLDGLPPVEAIDRFVGCFLRVDLLTEDATDLLRARVTRYLTDKYLPMLESSPGPHRLASAYFHLERFRGLQGFGESQYTVRFSDVFLPFACTAFVRAAFGAPTAALHKSRPESLHRELERRLDDGRLRGVPFATAAHWDASWVGRRIFNRWRQAQMYVERVRGRMKLASAMQWDFYRRNEDRFVALVEDSASSNLWHLLRRDRYLAWARSGPALDTWGMQALFRVLPILDPEMGAWGAPPLG